MMARGSLASCGECPQTNLCSQREEEAMCSRIRTVATLTGLFGLLFCELD